jgi:hypothetical protein
VAPLSIDTAAARDAAGFARDGLGRDLAQQLSTLERTARAAELWTAAAPALSGVRRGADDAVAIASMLEEAAAAAERADVWSSTAILRYLGGDPPPAPRVFGDALDEAAGLARDVARWWTGGADATPFGRFLFGVGRSARLAGWLVSGRGPVAAMLVHERLGAAAAEALRRVPAAARAGAWVQTPPAAALSRGLGVFGGAVSTAAGAHRLWEQGDPVDAFRREGAGYVADVASTAFHASSTAFLLAPNPVTAGPDDRHRCGVGSGPRRGTSGGDDMSGWIGERIVVLDAGWDAARERAGALWDTGLSLAGGADDAVGVVGGALADAWNGIFG